MSSSSSSSSPSAASAVDLTTILDASSLIGPAGLDGFYTAAPAVDTLVHNKAVGIYFSAGWCPPCKKFTPTLEKAYRALPADKRIEIIFVSSDHDEDAFSEYFAKMPWLAVNYEREDVREALKAAFSVKTLPTLVVVGSDGRLLATDGRAAIETNAQKTLIEWSSAASSL
jgi:thiol-disulfide isomerase/thioredoxin